MGRTLKTEDEYLARAEQLLARYGKATGASWRDDPLAACRYIAGIRGSWAKRTWQLYRASLCLFMERHGPREAVEYLRSCGQSVCLTRPVRTSARKAKAFPQEDLLQLINELARRKGRFDKLLGLWLVAGRTTGLRPHEWEKASLQGTTLLVHNAKRTNGRAHGPTRTLDLANISEARLGVVRAFLELLAGFLAKGIGFEFVKETCRRRLTRVNDALWPGRAKRPTLYSGRHQLTADLKRSGLGLAEIAAVLGHASDATASAHYGRRIRGEDEPPPLPVPEDVARVRPKFRGARPHPEPKRDS